MARTCIVRAGFPGNDGFTLLHRKRAADQGLIQAAAQYRSTVLTAFQDVADTLHALVADAMRAAVETRSTRPDN